MVYHQEENEARYLGPVAQRPRAVAFSKVEARLVSWKSDQSVVRIHPGSQEYEKNTNTI